MPFMCMANFAASLKKLKGLQTVAITTNGPVLTRKFVALQRAGLARRSHRQPGHTQPS